jgi:hypothetical protein
VSDVRQAHKNGVAGTARNKYVNEMRSAPMFWVVVGKLEAYSTLFSATVVCHNGPHLVESSSKRRFVIRGKREELPNRRSTVSVIGGERRRPRFGKLVAAGRAFPASRQRPRRSSDDFPRITKRRFTSFHLHIP